MVGAIRRFKIDATAQRIPGADVEFAPVEFVEQGPGFAIGDSSRFAMLQRPLPGPLIIRHFDNKDHFCRVIDQFAGLQERAGVLHRLTDIERRRAVAGDNPHSIGLLEQLLGSLPRPNCVDELA